MPSLLNYLAHTTEVNDYLQARERQAAGVRQANERLFNPAGIRARLLARQAKLVVIWLLADENFNNNIVRGVRLRETGIDLVRVQDISLAGADGPSVLEWAAQHRRILLTHDASTITAFAYNRVCAGKPMLGVFGVDRAVALRSAIDDILLLATCSADGEWDGQVLYLPLR